MTQKGVSQGIFLKFIRLLLFIIIGTIVRKSTLTMKDIQGIDRGRCNKCPTVCAEYTTSGDGGSVRCTCGHTPADHEATGTTTQRLAIAQAPSGTPPERPRSSRGASSSPFPFADGVTASSCELCPYPGCNQPVEFDLNTGVQGDRCPSHRGAQLPSLAVTTSSFAPNGTGPLPVQYPGGFPPTSSPFPFTPAPVPPLPPGAVKCAIQECPNPCFVDPSGKAHQCCGYTHAMEHQRRLALQQQVNQNVVKGTTHCLLPECSNPCWPFMNYCGKTHAQTGMQRGLQAPSPPAPSPSAPKDSTMCILPECNRAKYKDQSGTIHPYCGKAHADMGKTRGIVPTADSDDDRCELEGCTRPKRKEGTMVHNYCCRDHATQGESQLLTPRSKVDAFLRQFPQLNVVKLEENDQAKPGGTLYERYKAKALSMPKDQRKTCLAFHGTPEQNIPSICKNGYDPTKRSGQAYGPGEYFAATPDISLSYCRSGKKMLLNELLLGVAGRDHTQSGNIIVMKDPVHDLPRYVITFS